MDEPAVDPLTDPAVDAQQPQEPQQPQSPLLQAISVRMQQRRDQDAVQMRDTLRTNFAAAQQSNPEHAGEAQQIAKQLGITSSQGIEDNLAVQREFARRQAFREEDLMRQSPLTAIAFRNIEFAKVAQDDLDNLSGTESTWTRLKQAWETGQIGNEIADIGLRRRADPQGNLMPQDARQLAWLRERMARMRPLGGLFGGAVEMAGGAAGMMANAAAVGAGMGGVSLLAGPGAPALFGIGFGVSLFTQAASGSTGALYEHLREAGYAHDVAARASLVGGLVDGALMTIGNHYLMKGSGTVLSTIGESVAKKVAGDVAAEMVRPVASAGVLTFAKGYALGHVQDLTMTAQRAVDMFAEEAARRGSKNPEELTSAISRDEFGKELITTLKDAFVANALIALPGPLGGVFLDVRRARAATLEAQDMARIADLSEASKTRARNPDAHAGVTSDYAGDRGTLWAKGEDVAAVLHQLDKQGAGGEDVPDHLVQPGKATETIQKLFPDLWRQVQETKDTGGDVAIPAADFYSKMAGGEIQKALKPHVRYDVNGMSPAEAAPVLREVDKLVSGAQAEAKAQGAQEQAFQASARKVEDQMRVQLAQTQRMPDAQARDGAALYRAGIEQLARKLGLTPEEVQGAHGLTVEAGAPPEGALHQGALESDAFKKWFGRSVAVDKEGKPLRLFHGTAADFTTFDPRGLGSWFSESPETAADYAEIASRAGGSQQIKPAFVSLQKPASGPVMYDAFQEAKNRGLSGKAGLEFARQQLEAAGYDGVIYAGELGKRGFVAFRPEQIKSASGNRGTFDPNDPNILHQGPSRGSYDPRRMVAMLHEKADFSTFAHETAHHFFEVYSRLAADPAAHESVRTDFAALLKDFGVKDVETWNAMSLEQQRPHLESFASRWELWLATGKAPTVEMKSLFRRFSLWIRGVYTSIRDQLNADYRRQFGKDLPILTGEVREVMERMIASEDAINESKARSNEAALFMTKEEATKAGFSPQDWEHLNATRQDATDEAVEELQREKLAATDWFAKAQGKASKAVASERRKVEAGVKARVAEEVAAEPVRRAEHWLKTGEMVDEQGRVEQMEGSHRLDAEAVRRLAGPGADLSRIEKWLSKTGHNPDSVAESFGYHTGEDLVKALLAAPDVKDDIAARTEQRMQRDYADLTDPKQVQRRVNEATHNEASARFQATAIKHLEKSLQPIRTILKGARLAAQYLLGDRQLRGLNPDVFLAAELRVGKEVREAMKKGDTPAAAQALRKQLLQNQLASVAMESQREVEKGTRTFARLMSMDEASMAKTRNVDVLNAARALLASAGYGTERQAEAVGIAMDRLKQYSPEVYSRTLPVIMESATWSGDPRSLTLLEFRDLRDTVKDLWDQAKLEKQVEVNGRAVAVEAAVGELNAGIPKKPTPAMTESPTPMQRFARGVYNLRALVRRTESWADRMGGAFLKYLTRPVHAGLDRWRVEDGEYLTWFAKELGKLDLTWDKIASNDLGHKFANKLEVLGAFMHSGNAEGPQSNLWKLLGGRGWGAVDEQSGQMDLSRWNAFREDMFKRGIVTKRDMDFLQAIWTKNEESKPRLQRAFHDAFGYHMDEVTATPQQTPWGTYDGGYVPAKADPIHPNYVPPVTELGAFAAVEGEMLQSVPHVPRGMTETRTGQARPLLLDIRLAPRGMSDVLRFINVHAPVRDALRIVRNEDFRSAMKAADPSAIDGMLMPMLERAASQRTSSREVSPEMARFLNGLRQRTGMAALAFSLGDTFLRTASILPAMLKTGATRYAASLVKFLGARGQMAKDIAATSDFMNDRLNRQVQRMRQEMEDLVHKPSIWRSATKWSERHFYWLQDQAHHLLDITTWDAAYNKALEESGATASDAEAKATAVATADEAVRASQGSRNPEDVAPYEASHPFVNLFTQYSSYFVTQGNLIATEALKGRIAAAAFVGFLAPALLSGAIVNTVSGRWKAKEDEDSNTALLRYLFWAPTHYGLSMVPFGTTVNSLIGEMFGWPGSDAILSSPLASAASRTAKGIHGLFTKDETTGSDIRDSLTLVTLLTGIPMTPLARAIGYQHDVGRGAVVPSDAVDYLRGLASGRASMGTKVGR